MAQIGRSGLIGESNSKFPTNNAKQIKAVDHRSYNSDIIDSKFNWVDDDIPLVWWDKVNNITLADYLNNLEGEIGSLVEGRVFLGDLNQATVSGFGSGAVSGDITANIKVTVTFSVPLLDTNYYAQLQVFTPSVSLSNSGVGSAVFIESSKTINSFEFYLREFVGEAQSIGVYVKIIKKNF